MYFVDPKDALLTKESKIKEECDPIYQNTANESVVENQTNQRASLNLEKNGRQKVRKRHSFCSVRVSTCTDDTRIETQQVSAFIGKIFTELDSFYMVGIKIFCNG